jgi:predicted component of type VI protein secretion system
MIDTNRKRKGGPQYLAYASGWRAADIGFFMNLSLVVLSPGKSEGQAIPVNMAQFLIGRGPQCNLRPANISISKRHCALLRQRGKIIVRDFASTNGTYVNGKPVKYEVELRDGDLLEMGPLAFSVHMGTGPAIDRPTPLPPTRKSSSSIEEEAAAAMFLEIANEAPEMPLQDSIEGKPVLEVPADFAPDLRPIEEETKRPETRKTSQAADEILNKYLRRPRS